MGLLRFKDFNKMRVEVKEQKLKERESNKFKKAFLETLSKYGATDPSQLDEDQLSEFLEAMKTYKKNNIIDNEKNSQL
jgi:hypothetical protein